MDFFLILVVASPGPNVWKKIVGGGGLQIFFIFVDMGPYGSENFKTLLLQIAAETFQFFLNSLPIGPHKTMFGIYEMLKIKILTILFFSISSTWHPVGMKILKRYSSYKSQAKVFKLYS